MKPHLITIILGACIPMTTLAGTPIDPALKHVPTDMAMVVAVPDWDDFSKGLHDFGLEAGINALVEFDTTNLIAHFLGGELKDLSPRGTVLMALKPGPVEPLFVGRLLNPQIWEKPRKPEANDDGVLTLKIGEESWFAGHIGTIDMIAKTREVLRTAMNADGSFVARFAPVSETVLQGRQLIVWADVNAWRPIIEPAFLVGEGLLQMSTAMSDPKAHGSTAMLKWIFEKARLVVSESQTYAAGFHFGPKGALGTDWLALRPDGEIAAELGQLRRTNEDALRGLPGEPGMLVFASEWLLPEEKVTLSESMLSAMIQAHKQHGLPLNSEAKKGLDAAFNFYREISGYSGTMDKAPGGGIVITGIYLTDQPKEAVSDLLASFESLTSSDFMGMMSSMMTMDVARARERVGDIEADVFTLVFESESEEVRKALEAVYGMSIKYYVAPHAEGVVYAMGAGNSGRDAFLKIFDEKAQRLMRDERIAAARKTIMHDPHFSVFVDMSKVVDFGTSMWQSLGGPSPNFTLSTDKSPLVAFGIYLKQTSMLSELFVPAPALRQIIDSMQQEDTASANKKRVTNLS
ncbi:MAG: hypothetical protein ACYTHJ_00635 [Planctomycetota bacterium]|jgi:hypothetical protein